MRPFIRLRITKLYRSKRALAIPTTFLILFVSTLGLISVTYYFAIQRISTQSQTLNVSNAEQDMICFNEAIVSTMWSPGSATTFTFGDSGGQVNVLPTSNAIAISITDNQDINATIFNETTGQVFYALSYSESVDTGLYLEGDSRTIINQSGPAIAQLCITSGPEYPEILLRYRPVVSYATAGIDNDSNRTINDIRVYLVTLNASDPISSYGQVPLRISCSDTQITSTTYNLSYAPGALSVTSIMDGASGQVSVPISSTSNGAIVNVDLVLCSIQIESWVM